MSEKTTAELAKLKRERASLFSEVQDVRESWTRCITSSVNAQKEHNAAKAEILGALELALSVAEDCQQRWSRGHAGRVAEARAVLVKARGT